MEFDKTEAAKEFPGLYAGSKTAEEESRNFLSVKKKKDKDKGYKAFEEDGSGASCEDVAKVPSSILFKFGISTSKTTTNKPVKVKLFGVDLKEVLRRNPSMDPRSPKVPKFLTELLNYIEKEYKPGVNFYKGTSHFKSKIHQARHALNYGEDIDLQEPQIAAGLVKMFLRELPGHILGSVMESKLEETKPTEKKIQKIQSRYVKDVADVNKKVFERLVLHIEIIGIDLTPLLKVTQKALSVLKPVMSPLSIEDELKVGEARLARIHLSVTKAGDSKDKNKAKQNQEQEKLWEAQRNVTQLKRKLKQISSGTTTEIKEVEMNLEERRESDVPHDSGDADAAARDKDAARSDQSSRGNVEASEPEAETSSQTEPAPENLDNQVRVHVADSTILPIAGDSEKRDPTTTRKETSEIGLDHDRESGQRENAPLPLEPKISPAAPASPAKNEAGETGTAVKFEDEHLILETKESSTVVIETNPEPHSPRQMKSDASPSDMTLDAGELSHLQEEWKNVIGEQVELRRMTDDIRRRIRDEHKQIKMIQMVRNHRSRLMSMKPAFQDPLEKMSTEKLHEIRQRLIDVNVKLTQDAQTLADKVFDERMSLVHLRKSRIQPMFS